MTYKIEQIEQKIRQKQSGIEKILRTYLPKEEGLQKTVISAMNYSFLAGGKRLRPLLIQECFVLLGGTGSMAEPFMAAIEMIHTYSLIHDDLPAMDNDEYRRGKKTAWAVYGEDMGILAGDGLLNLAMETALKAYDVAGADPIRISKALQLLFVKSGIYGMIGGQTADVELTGRPLDEEQLNFIYRLKTSALMEAAMGIGAILAGANEEELALVLESALSLGLAFQIQDDVLDVTSTPEVLGKPIGSDERNQKTTYVTLKGLKAAIREVERLSARAAEAIRRVNGENEFLIDLISYLTTRDK